tara:strand:+ start:9196 stop:10611 length:1416 start_codon:yes stop_codon:yes gene_type:complete
MDKINLIYPELLISISIMFLLMFGVFVKKSTITVYNLSSISLFGSLILMLSFPMDTNWSLFNNSYQIDYLSTFMKILTLLFGIFVLAISKKYILSIKILKIEYPILILSSILGMIVMISSNDLIIFYIGLELQSLALYVLASFNRDNILSSESGVKYFVLSALSSGLLLYGCSLIYGFSGSTNFQIISEQIISNSFGLTFGIVFILVGLAFKISAVPFHMWAPDVYQGSPTSVTAFFALLPKVAALTVLIRILYVPFLNMLDQWQLIIVFLSIASMILGSVAAISQKNLKRLIAYSSISHMGYALAGISTGTNQGIQSSITYISIYLIMNLAFFSCLFMMKKNDKYYENLDDLSGISKKHPVLSFCFLIILFSLAGIPPLAGFFAKFYIFTAVIEQSMFFLAVVGLLSTVIAAFYYLRIIKIIYFDSERETFDKDHNISLRLSLLISTVLIIFYFIYPSTLTEIIAKIIVI